MKPPPLDTRYIDCDDHGNHRKAYIVCIHLLNKPERSLIGHHKPWSNTPTDGAGEVCCSLPHHTHDQLRVLCESHLLETGLLQPGERRLT